MKMGTASRQFCAMTGIAGTVALASTANAVNLVPLRDAKFNYLCVDFDSIRTEATGWTIFGVTYCSGTHGGQAARVLYYAVSCSEYLSTNKVNLQFYTVRWEPKQADRVDQLSVQLVCSR
jgi:hypothetical protein